MNTAKLLALCPSLGGNFSGVVPTDGWATAFVSGQITLLYPLLFAMGGLAASHLQLTAARKLIVGAGSVSLALGASAISFHAMGVADIAGLASIEVSLLALAMITTKAAPQITSIERLLLASLYASGMLAIAFEVWVGTFKPSPGLLPYPMPAYSC